MRLDPLIVPVSARLAATRRPFDGFGKIAILAPFATNSLDGDGVRTYTTTTDASDDVTAGFLSTTIRDAVVTAFSQPDNDIDAVKVFSVDLVGGTDYGEGLVGAVALDADFYGVNIASRAAADAVLVATAIETMERIAFFQSSASAWKTPSGGVPTAYAALATRERNAVIFHDTDAKYADVAWSANRLGYSADRQSVGWKCPIYGVDPYAANLTSSESTAARANMANTAEPFGTEPMFVYPGRTVKGRSVDHLLTRDLFAIRTREDAAAFVITMAKQGRKITCDLEGQSYLMALVDARLQIMIAAGHFRAGQVVIERGPIDRNAATITVKGRATLTVDALILPFEFNFETDDVVVPTL